MNIFEKIEHWFENIHLQTDQCSVKIKQGDTLSEICEDLTGDGDRWKEAVPLNPGRDLNDLHPGDEINVPREWFHAKQNP